MHSTGVTTTLFSTPLPKDVNYYPSTTEGNGTSDDAESEKDSDQANVVKNKPNSVGATNKNASAVGSGCEVLVAGAFNVVLRLDARNYSIHVTVTTASTSAVGITVGTGGGLHGAAMHEYGNKAGTAIGVTTLSIEGSGTTEDVGVTVTSRLLPGLDPLRPASDISNKLPAPA